MSNQDEVVFQLTREDVIQCAEEMGIPASAINEEVLALVKKYFPWGLECWSETVKAALNLALKS
jgi:hypothetical protein